LTSQNIGV